MRLRLADSMRYIVSQRLAPKIGGGRQLLSEIMGHNLRTRETIALGEAENRSFYEIIEASAPFGWTTFDQSILKAYEAGAISEETASLFASKKGRITRGIDLIQKTRGIDNQGRHRAAARSARQRFSLGNMETDQESNFFDVGEKTALVCIDHPQYQKLVVPH